MQKFKKMVVGMCAVLLLCTVIGALRENSKSIISNRELEREIRIQIGKPQGEITPEDCLGITELELESVGKNLDGIQYFHDLEVLRCHRGYLSDISAISGLTNLRIIDFHQNSIRDLTPLSGLTKLEILILQENKIKDLTPLASLTNLKTLIIGQNPVYYMPDEYAYAPLSKLYGLRIGAYAEAGIVIGESAVPQSPNAMEK